MSTPNVINNVGITQESIVSIYNNCFNESKRRYSSIYTGTQLYTGKQLYADLTDWKWHQPWICSVCHRWDVHVHLVVETAVCVLRSNHQTLGAPFCSRVVILAQEERPRCCWVWDDLIPVMDHMCDKITPPCVTQRCVTPDTRHISYRRTTNAVKCMRCCLVGGRSVSANGGVNIACTCNQSERRIYKRGLTWWIFTIKGVITRLYIHKYKWYIITKLCTCHINLTCTLWVALISLLSISFVDDRPNLFVGLINATFIRLSRSTIMTGSTFRIAVIVGQFRRTVFPELTEKNPLHTLKLSWSAKHPFIFKIVKRLEEYHSALSGLWSAP